MAEVGPRWVLAKGVMVGRRCCGGCGAVGVLAGGGVLGKKCHGGGGAAG